MPRAILSTSPGSASDTLRSMGVSVGPGQTTLAVTCALAASRASVLARPKSPALVAAYAPSPPEPALAPSEEMNTSRPQPRSSMPGSSSLVSSIGPRRLTCHMRSQSAGSLSTNGRTIDTPALCTRMSARPTAPANSATATGDARSTGSASASWRVAATFAAPGRSTSATTTFAPSAARSAAMAAPIAPAAPVTTAVRPSRRIPSIIATSPPGRRRWCGWRAG